MTKRTRYLINKKMQLGLTLRFVAVTVLFYVFVAYMIYSIFAPFINVPICEGPLYQMKCQILERMLLFSVPLIFVLVCFGIVFSHRVAGPLFRIEKTLDMVIRGEDVGHIKLRKKDELVGLVDRINKVILIIKELKTGAEKK